MKGKTCKAALRPFQSACFVLCPDLSSVCDPMVAFYIIFGDEQVQHHHSVLMYLLFLPHMLAAVLWQIHQYSVFL